MQYIIHIMYYGWIGYFWGNMFHLFMFKQPVFYINYSNILGMFLGVFIAANDICIKNNESMFVGFS